MVFFSLGVITIHRQNINTFNYQAVAHDPLTNQILANQDLNVKFYIGTNAQDPENDYLYTEEHTLTTNDFGLFYTKVGDVDPGIFSDIQWGIETYYFTVVINDNLVSTDLMVAVPYAISANNANTVNYLDVESAVPVNAVFSDNQNIYLNGDSLSIDNGNSIDMSPLKTKEIISTDYNSPFLTITFNDGSSYDANLSSLLNTDNQTLSTTTDSLIISNGNAIPLSSLGASQWTATGNDIQNNNAGKVGIGTSSFIGKLNITTDANTERGLYILNNTSSNSTFGKFGVYANVDGGGSGDNVGAWFDALGNATGINYGVAGYASGTNGENRGVFGAANYGTSNWAGYFADGDVKVENKLVIGSNTSPGQFQLKDGNQGFNRILRSDAQGNAEWVQVGTMGVGVMLKSIYDTNNNGVVDDAETVNGFQVGTHVPANAVFSDDQDATAVFYDNTSSNLSAINVQAAIDEVNQNVGGLGDMNTSIYDTDNNGIVDNAETVNGFQVGTNVPANADFSDDQQLSTNGLDASNVVRINISNGNYIDLNLSALNNSGSDNQDLTGASFNPSNGLLTIDIQNGNSVSVNLSSLVNTDNQILSASSDSIFISNGNGIPKDLLTSPDTDWIITGNNIYNGNVGNVGIGTSNPGSKLNIKGPDNNTLLKLERNGIIGGGLGVTYRGANDGYEIQSGDQGGISLEALGNHELKFETNGQERMLIEGNGNISMGSSGASPSTTLDISGSLTVKEDNQNNGGDVFFKNLPVGNNYDYQSVMIDTTNGKLYRMSSADGWGGYPGGGSVWTENGSDIYYDSGDVGVGTNNPQKSLHVYGEVSNYPNVEPSNGNDGVFIDIQNAGLGYQKVAGIRFKTKHGLFENAYYHAGIFFRGNPNDLDQRGTLYFSNKNSSNTTGVGTADADMVIKPDGKIGVGLLNPDEQLHVDGKLKIGSSSNGYTFPTNRGNDGQYLVLGSTPGQLEWANAGSGGNGGSASNIDDLGDAHVNIGKESIYMGHIPSSPNLDSSGSINTQQNTTLGIETMKNLYDGRSNTAIGYQSLRDVEDGAYNVSIGNLTLSGNNGSYGNVAVGSEAMYSSETDNNTAIGRQALYKNDIGLGYNVAIGYQSGMWYGSGSNYNTGAQKSTYIGSKTRPQSGSDANSIVIGYEAVGEGDNTVVLGNDDITDTYLKGKINVNGSYILPNTAGQAGEVLKMPATGNELVWAPEASGSGGGGGSNVWTTSGSNIHYNSGNVGIGVSSPNKKLEVSGESKFIGNVIIGSSSGSGTGAYVTFTASGNTPSTLNGRYDQASGYVYDSYDSEIETAQNASYFYNSTKNAGFFRTQFNSWYLVTDVTPGTDNSASSIYSTSLWGYNSSYCDGSCPNTGSAVYTSGGGANFELNTGHGGNANMVPVAYGTVNNSGSKLNDASTPNFTVTRNNTGIYTVNFSDFDFDGTKFMVSCSIKSTNLGHIIYYQDGTTMKIKTYDSQGSLSNRGFSFLVFHP